MGLQELLYYEPYHEAKVKGCENEYWKYIKRERFYITDEMYLKIIQRQMEDLGITKEMSFSEKTARVAKIKYIQRALEKEILSVEQTANFFEAEIQCLQKIQNNKIFIDNLINAFIPNK